MNVTQDLETLMLLEHPLDASAICSICGAPIVEDPNGSPGVIVHDSDTNFSASSGLTSFDLDADHAPVWDLNA